MHNKLVNKLISFFESPIIKFPLIYFILLFIFLIFGNRIGFEGDDLSQLEGIVNFQYKGAVGVYEYYWQPLAYHLNIFVIHVVGNPNFVLVMPQIFGAANIVLLMASVYLFSKKKISLLMIFSFLLLLPELFFTGLYYNSSVFAMFPMIIALFFLFLKPSSSFWNDIRYIVIGSSSTLSVFFRFEFILCLPLICYLIIVEPDFKIRKIFLPTLSSILILSLGLMTGIFDPVKIFEFTQRYQNLNSETVWSSGLSPGIIFTAINIFAWISLFVYGVYFVISTIKKTDWKAFLILLPIAVLLYPFTKRIDSPKYLLPGIIFLPFIFTIMVMELQKRLGRIQFKWLSYVIITVSILLQIVSFQLSHSFPYIEISKRPTYINTFDGSRPLGAYFGGYNQVRTQPYLGPDAKLARKLKEIIETSGQNFTIIYLDKEDNITASPWSWAWPSFFLQMDGYQVNHYILNKEIELAKDKQVVLMKQLNEEQFMNYPEDGKTTLIKIPYTKKNKENDYTLLRKFRESLNASPKITQ